MKNDLKEDEKRASHFLTFTIGDLLMTLNNAPSSVHSDVRVTSNEYICSQANSRAYILNVYRGWNTKMFLM